MEVLEVLGVPLYYAREARNMISLNFSRKAHHTTFCGQAVHLGGDSRRKGIYVLR